MNVSVLNSIDIHRSPDLSENEVPNILEVCGYLLKGDYAKVASFVEESEPLGWTFVNHPNVLAIPFFLYANWNRERTLTFAETYWSNSESEKGQMLINHFQKKYNRHSAFQKELKVAIKESHLFTIK